MFREMQLGLNSVVPVNSYIWSSKGIFGGIGGGMIMFNPYIGAQKKGWGNGDIVKKSNCLSSPEEDPEIEILGKWFTEKASVVRRSGQDKVLSKDVTPADVTLKAFYSELRAQRTRQCHATSGQGVLAFIPSYQSITGDGILEGTKRWGWVNLQTSEPRGLLWWRPVLLRRWQLWAINGQTRTQSSWGIVQHPYERRSRPAAGISGPKQDFPMEASAKGGKK